MSTTITTTALTNGVVGFCYDATQVDTAQSITMTAAGTVSSVLVNMYKVGSPTGTITVGIQADVSGHPSNTFLASGTVPVASLSGTQADFTITLGSPVTVTNSTVYWIVFHSDGTRSTSNYITAAGAATGSPYAGGNNAYSNTTPTWTNDLASDLRVVLTIDPLTVLAVNATATDGGAESISFKTAGLVDFDKCAQPFTVGFNGSVGTIKVSLKKFGTPTGTLRFRIYDNSGGATNPEAGVLLGGQDNVVDTSNTGAFSVITQQVSAQFALVTATTYWLVVDSTQATSNTNYWTLSLCPNTTYTNDYYRQATVWTSETGYNFIFEINTNFTPVSLPSPNRMPSQAVNRASTY